MERFGELVDRALDAVDLSPEERARAVKESRLER